MSTRTTWTGQGWLIFGASSDPFASVDVGALAEDLRVFMRGPGAQFGQDGARIGPALRPVCGIAASDAPVEAVDAAAAWLRVRVGTLGSEERMLLSTAFGLHESARFPDVRSRLAVAARQLDRSELTVRRHTAAAIGVLARTTTPDDSVPFRLRGHAGRWVRLDYVVDESLVVVTARCFLMAVSRAIDQRDKIHAIVRVETHHGDAVAIPAVRVRYVAPASHPGMPADP